MTRVMSDLQQDELASMMNLCSWLHHEETKCHPLRSSEKLRWKKSMLKKEYLFSSYVFADAKILRQQDWWSPSRGRASMMDICWDWWGWIFTLLTCLKVSRISILETRIPTLSWSTTEVWSWYFASQNLNEEKLSKFRVFDHCCCINFSGYTIMHPDLKRPSLMDQQPMYTDISHFEDYPEFREIRQDILRFGSCQHFYLFVSKFYLGLIRFSLILAAPEGRPCGVMYLSSSLSSPLSSWPEKQPLLDLHQFSTDRTPVYRNVCFLWRLSVVRRRVSRKSRCRGTRTTRRLRVSCLISPQTSPSSIFGRKFGSSRFVATVLFSLCIVFPFIFLSGITAVFSSCGWPIAGKSRLALLSTQNDWRLLRIKFRPQNFIFTDATTYSLHCRDENNRGRIQPIQRNSGRPRFVHFCSVWSWLESPVDFVGFGPPWFYKTQMLYIVCCSRKGWKSGLPSVRPASDWEDLHASQAAGYRG